MLDIKNFQYDQDSNQHHLRTKLNGKRLDISVSDEEMKGQEALNARLNESFQWVLINLDTILNYCADNLVELKNESWVDDEDEEVSAEEFKKKLRLEGITINPDGSLELAFDDGDLFWGHQVIVTTDAAHHLTDADIEG